MIRKIIRPFFVLWEIFFAWKEKIHPLEGSPYQLLRYNVHPYEGKPIPLADGSEIKPGDYVAELHVSNLAVAKGKVGDTEVSSDLQLLPLFREEMSLLGRYAAYGKLDPRVQAIWGVTLFTAAVRRMGFSIRPMEEGRERESLKRWMDFLRWLFAPDEVNTQSKSRAARQPSEFWMSRSDFINKYGK